MKSTHAPTYFSPAKATSKLLAAAHNGKAANISTLLALGADPRARNRSGRSPLHLASARGNAKAIATLLPLSDPLALDHAKMTPLALAILGGHPHAMALLGLREDNLAPLSIQVVITAAAAVRHPSRDSLMAIQVAVEAMATSQSAAVALFASAASAASDPSLRKQLSGLARSAKESFAILGACNEPSKPASTTAARL